MSELNLEILKILEKVAKAENIKNYELKPELNAEVGDGFFSSFYQGDVLNKDTGKSFKVAIKTVAQFEYDYDSIFGNEIIFYTKILPALIRKQQEVNLPNPFDNTPKYFVSSLNHSEKFLALEHLKPQNYVMHEKKKFLSQDQLEMVFQTYGKFHALGFVFRKQDFEGYQELNRGLKDQFSLFTEKDFSKASLTRTVQEALNNLEESSAAQKEGKVLFKNVIPTVEKSFIYKGSYRCFTHGDCWSNNMLFKFHESGKLENIKLLDFQLARDGTPIHDLSYFFYSSAAKKDLDSLEDYLKIYHDSFSQTVKGFGEDPEEIFPYKVLMKEWKENALMGVILGAHMWRVKLLDKGDYEDLLKPVGSKESMEDTMKPVINLINAVFKSETYRSLSRDLFQHAYDFGILTRDLAA